MPIEPPVTDAAPCRVGAGMGHLPFDVAGRQPFPLPGGARTARPGNGGAAAEGPIERRLCFGRRRYLSNYGLVHGALL